MIITIRVCLRIVIVVGLVFMILMIVTIILAILELGLLISWWKLTRKGLCYILMKGKLTSILLRIVYSL